MDMDSTLVCVVWLAGFGFKDVVKIGNGSSMFGEDRSQKFSNKITMKLTRA